MTDNKNFLKQARTRFQGVIDEDKQSVTITRKAMTSDGFGGIVQDPSGIGTDSIILCRICEGKTNPSQLSGSPVGLSENLVKYIIVNYKTDIQENDTFTARGKSYRINSIEVIANFGGIVGYQAKLTEATETGVST